VVEAAHEFNAASRAVDWRATGKTPGTLADGRERNPTVFRAINAFHEAARVDLGVGGSFERRGPPGAGPAPAGGTGEGE
jgi:hypothetical protein